MPDREFKIRITTTSDSSGTRETTSELGKVKEAGVTANKEIAKETENLTVKKRDLRSMVKGLREEFPQLGHFARLAINPIAFVVAGVTAAFVLWRDRVADLQRVLGGVELPEITPMQIGHVNAMAEAYGRYRESLRQVVEGYNTIEQSSSRALTKMREELELRKEILKAEEELDKARGGTGARARNQSRLEDEREMRQEVDMQVGKAFNLSRSAKGKREEAGKIHVASAADDAKTQAELDKQAEAAQKELDARKSRIGDLVEFQSNEASILTRMRVLYRLRLHGKVDSDQDVQSLLDMERQGLGGFENVVKRANDFRGRSAGRDEQRKRRDTLLGDAGKEEGESANIMGGVPEAAGRVDRRVATNRQVDLLGAEKDLTDAQAKTQSVSQRIAESIRGHQMVTAAMLEELRADRARVATLEAEVRSLRATRGSAPPSI